MKLLKVTLNPCPGQVGFKESDHAYSATEMVDVGGILRLVLLPNAFGSIAEAEDYYKLKLGGLRLSRDMRTDGAEDANFIVSGSHAFCSECRAYLREQRVLDIMTSQNVSRDKAVRIEGERRSSVMARFDQLRCEGTKKHAMTLGHLKVLMEVDDGEFHAMQSARVCRPLRHAQMMKAFDELLKIGLITLCGDEFFLSNEGKDVLQLVAIILSKEGQ